MKIKAVITGSTGMVGRAVLLECLESDEVKSVVVVNRRSLNMSHPKLTEIVHSDLCELESIKEKITGCNACFFCMGVSALGLSEDQYHDLTFKITHSFASYLNKINPNMVFNYVSGSGTDSSEKGRVMWARVKGKTENMILKMGFRDAYMFRPGMILPEKGVKSKTALYNFFYVILRPLFPLFRMMKSVTTSSRLGKAMINSVIYPQENKFLENTDINLLAGRSVSLVTNPQSLA